MSGQLLTLRYPFSRRPDGALSRSGRPGEEKNPSADGGLVRCSDGAVQAARRYILGTSGGGLICRRSTAVVVESVGWMFGTAALHFRGPGLRLSLETGCRDGGFPCLNVQANGKAMTASHILASSWRLIAGLWRGLISQIIPCGICVGQSGADSIIPPVHIADNL